MSGRNPRATLDVAGADGQSWKRVVFAIAVALTAVADAIYQLGDAVRGLADGE